MVLQGVKMEIDVYRQITIEEKITPFKGSSSTFWLKAVDENGREASIMYWPQTREAYEASPRDIKKFVGECQAEFGPDASYKSKVPESLDKGEYRYFQYFTTRNDGDPRPIFNVTGHLTKTRMPVTLEEVTAFNKEMNARGE
jgi:hypothetical protein